MMISNGAKAARSRKVGSSFDELEPEARRIVWATFKTYPVEILYRSLKDAGRQILRFQTGDGLTVRYARLVAPSLGEVFGPALERSVLESRQGRGELPIAEFRFLSTVGVIFGLSVVPLVLHRLAGSAAHAADCFADIRCGGNCFQRDCNRCAVGAIRSLLSTCRLADIVRRPSEHLLHNASP